MSTTDAGGPAPRRGRPTVLDRGAVATATFRLWTAHGYDAVGWGDIADATGVSVRTLVRHFSRKSEIAWVGVPAATKRLREALRATPDDLPVSDAVRRSVLASVSHDPMLASAGVDWVRVVYAQEEIAGSAGAAYRPWIEELAGYIAGRVPEITRATATAIASGYQAATFAALVAWSEGGARGDAVAATDEALRWLEIPPGADPRTG
ncbi:helix-turn-helix domain containing protein [Saccharopolyspora sp. NFXS83]|uniref:TetR/AcrR family transcriptional regulator n=1 Tax=Saccharopolyspora sp. NFXS83 TaxID=2993560 RepID=UPI00224AD7FE|nr:TetR/AcrR family transcriptional regulator [Saccharopolyspora sp. NFXS83]MCX2734006.1 helix-turn-helix domain containing protein [Saccharopolyspora sp. NFXS83]